MKKIYVLSIASLLGYGSLNAQTALPAGKPFKGEMPKKKIERIDNSGRAVQTFYTDYEAADRFAQNVAFGYENYFQFITDANTAYGSTVNSLLYPVTCFYNLNDSYGLIVGDGEPKDLVMTAGTSLTIDSVFMVIGHFNSTSSTCSLQVKVLSLDGSNRPTGAPLFTKTVTATEFNPGATAWNFVTTYGVEMNYTLPVGVSKYGIQVDYIGAIADSFGFIYGAVGDYNACGSTGLEAYDAGGNLVPATPVVSTYDDNSLVANATYFGTYGLLPTTGGADFYIDCDGSGGATTGDGVSLYQNWAIWTRVTADVSISSVDENSVIANLEQNVPNPFNVNSTINYSLAQASEVTFTVTDLSGKVVLSQNQGKLAGGRHSITIDANSLESGVYYYTVTAGNAKQTRKMVVTK